MLIEGAAGGAGLAVVAFLLSRFADDFIGRALLAIVLIAAAGAYLGFAFQSAPDRSWMLLELLQAVAFGSLALVGLRGSPYWLALGWALHPVWDVGLHFLGPGERFAPWTYAIACLSFDLVVALYIVLAYRFDLVRWRSSVW
nr:MAG: hypothetical protein DIU56_01095 [Pseudomonadota bacterium]